MVLLPALLKKLHDSQNLLKPVPYIKTDVSSPILLVLYR